MNHRIIYEFDRGCRNKQWYYEVEEICETLHLPHPIEGVIHDMETVNSAIMKLSQDSWWSQAMAKPKLRSYLEFKDIDNYAVLVKANLLQYQWSLLSKISCGILSLKIETGTLRLILRSDSRIHTADMCATLNIDTFVHQANATC